jgi:arylsulfatase A-like enzyme
MYESTTSVPLIVYDSQAEAGRRASAATSGVDILPTILDYAGIERPESPHIAGRSLVPHIRSGESLRREHVVIEYNRFGAGHDAVGEFWPIRAIRYERYKLVVNLFDIDELYDLEADPTEEHNLLLGTPAALVGVRNEMHRELVRFMYRTKDLMRGRGWCERSWNTAREYDVKALFTTGYKDDWGGKAFAEV